MFRLIIFICFLHFSVGAIIRGRVLLNGDANKYTRVPYGSNLIISLQDTSLADAPAKILQQTRYSNLFSFPFSFQMDIPDNLEQGMRYSLSARINHGDTLLYLNDQHISVIIKSDSSMLIDIPVINVNPDAVDDTEQLSWPEMLGKDGGYAVQYIKQKSGLINVFTILENSPMTMDYRTDRVRIVVNNQGIVTQVPRVG